jgi:iron(III) transport system permease protein
MDALTTLILAIPGTAIGIAYIRAFHYPLPGIGVPLTSMWIILPIVLAVRRLPYTVRGTYASLLLVHQSLEEAAGSVGATKLRIFRHDLHPGGFGHPVPHLGRLGVVAALSLLVINRVAGTRMGGMFG